MKSSDSMNQGQELHYTNISIPVELAAEIEVWRIRPYVSDICTKALERVVSELEQMDPWDLPARQPRKYMTSSILKLQYPAALRDRIEPLRSSINVSEVCTQALQEHITALESLPEEARSILRGES